MTTVKSNTSVIAAVPDQRSPQLEFEIADHCEIASDFVCCFQIRDSPARNLQIALKIGDDFL